MSNLMQYSNLADIFRNEVDRTDLIIRLYERLRYDERINDEPLFWLQYAIAVTEAKQFMLAEQFIQTSYDRAAALSGFQTFQIDTQAFRILLLVETEAAPGTPVTRLPQIIKKLELLNSLLGEESHRSFAIKVLEGITPFIQKRRGDLAMAERTALMFWLSKLAEALERLPAEYRAREGSDQAKTKLEVSKRLLL